MGVGGCAGTGKRDRGRALKGLRALWEMKSGFLACRAAPSLKLPPLLLSFLADPVANESTQSEALLSCLCSHLFFCIKVWSMLS
ncbi:hypothetical protein BDZ45DRAFT_478134 [Acephala macrosclerotiorum]|nr:hypothetical protein BDZ45DRAFT_478134 [Acephala macrosclerotiorum]